LVREGRGEEFVVLEGTREQVRESITSSREGRKSRKEGKGREEVKVTDLMN
jgi:hypothetical protein